MLLSVIGILLAVLFFGYDSLDLSRPNFLRARICFVVFFATFLIPVFKLTYCSSWPFKIKLLIASASCLLLAYALQKSLRYVSNIEKEVQLARKSAFPVSIPIIRNPNGIFIPPSQIMSYFRFSALFCTIKKTFGSSFCSAAPEEIKQILGELLQFLTLENLSLAQRDIRTIGVIAGGTTSEVHVGVRLPEKFEYPLQDLRQALSSNRFWNDLTMSHWELQPLQLPHNSSLSISTEFSGDQISKWLISIERPNYFFLQYSIASVGSTQGLPLNFRALFAGPLDNASTYFFTITMEYKIAISKLRFSGRDYQNWADEVFNFIRKNISTEH